MIFNHEDYIIRKSVTKMFRVFDSNDHFVREFSSYGAAIKWINEQRG